MLMQRCWHQDPRLRPEVSDTLEVLLTPSVLIHSDNRTQLIFGVQWTTGLETVDQPHPRRGTAHFPDHNILFGP